MSKRSGCYPRPRVDVGAGVVSHAGGMLLTATISRVGLGLHAYSRRAERSLLLRASSILFLMIGRHGLWRCSGPS